MGSNIKLSSVVVNIPSGNLGDVTYAIFSFPFAVNIVQFSFITDGSHVGDQINLTMLPHTVIGQLITDCPSDSNEITVDKDTINRLSIGYFIDIDNGTDNNVLGPCTGINYEKSVITCLFSTKQAFAANSNVRKSIQIIDDLTVGPPNKYNITAAN